MARLRITYTKSAIGYNVKQKLTIQALGLRKLHQTVEHDDSPVIWGMVNKVPHLVRVERFEPDVAATAQEATAQ
ncbi:MAG TPA: 50S ribosomal protein L30 [Ktedonobacterales bacterium]|nr:50S ribosomal protein L30 [Ktedonobacterales bacterium]